MTSKQIVQIARKQLSILSDSSLAQANKSYFKSHYDFYGVSKKQINDLGKKIKRQWKDTTLNELEIVLSELQSSMFHEEKTLAIVLATNFITLFESKHVGSIFFNWIAQSQTWDHVDEISICLVGEFVYRNPILFNDLFQWSKHSYLWIQRASLISYLPSIRRKSSNLTILKNICSSLVEEEDFFIRKAIGWVLRELSEKEPDETINILRSISQKASKLTIREATRKLPKDLCQEVLKEINMQPLTRRYT